MIQAKERFAAYLRRRYGDRSTPKHYLSDLNVFLQVLEPQCPYEVTSQDIDRFIDEQQSRGLKATTINHRLATLHTFFEYLARDDDIEMGPNPVQWRRHRVKPGQPLPRDASDSDVQALFEAVENVRDRAIFGLMVGAGLRVGEVVALLVENVYSTAPVDQSTRLRVCGKGHKERMVWLTPHWHQVVSEWLAVRPTSESNHLFLNQHNRPLSVSGVQYRLAQYCQRANIQVTCHQLRHTFARRLAEQRMPTESIGQLLGHENVTTTQRYTAGADPQLRDAFLAVMANVAHTTEAEEGHTPSSYPKRQVDKVDPTILAKSLAVLDDLPPWLLPVVRAYFQRRWPGWQPHTASTGAPVLAHHLRRVWGWFLEERQLSGWETLRRLDVETWLTERQAAGIKPSSIRRELSLFKCCLREALTQDLPVSADLLRIEPPACPHALPRYLTPAEIDRLEQTVSDNTSEKTLATTLERAWFLTLLHTGVRCAELLNLRVSDVDFAGRRLVIHEGKDRRDRVVYLTPALRTALVAYLQQRPSVDDDHLWIKANGMRLAQHNVKYRLHRWGEACGVHVTPHRLRHTFATRLVNAGLPLASAAKLLGHRSLNMTQHYARLYEHTVKEQFIAAMENIEGIASSDWPRLEESPVTSNVRLEQTCDSV